MRHRYTSGELRKLLIRRDLPEFIDTDRLYILAKQIVDLACVGLVSRSQGEEKLLKPLYDRISSRTNPAKHMLGLHNRGVTLEDIIAEYVKIRRS